MRAHQRTYRAVFRRENGAGPYPCYFCGESVGWPELHVHHLDHDESNDAAENLSAAHSDCHLAYHSRMRVPSAETRALWSQQRRGVAKPETMRRKVSATLSGRAKPDEQVRRVVEARRRNGTLSLNGSRDHRCPGCELTTNAGALARHRKARGH